MLRPLVPFEITSSPDILLPHQYVDNVIPSRFNYRFHRTETLPVRKNKAGRIVFEFGIDKPQHLREQWHRLLAVIGDLSEW